MLADAAINSNSRDFVYVWDGMAAASNEYASMPDRLRLYSYVACTLLAFLTLGSAPRSPVARPRDLCFGPAALCLGGDNGPE